MLRVRPLPFRVSRSARLRASSARRSIGGRARLAFRSLSAFCRTCGPLLRLFLFSSLLAMKVLPSQCLAVCFTQRAGRLQGEPASTRAGRACDAAVGRELDLSLGHFRTYGVRHA